MERAVQHPIVKRVPRTIAVTSGKGGVGKTNVAVNTAIGLARKGYRVCVLDADMSLANVNILLGLQPEFTLEHVCSGQKRIREIVLSGPAGVDVVPGASGFTECLEMDAGQQARLIKGISSLELDYDYMIIDTAAGIGSNVLHFVASAQMALVVITPEPTSLTDAFSLIKVLHRKGYRRKIHVVVNMVIDEKKAKVIFNRFQAAVNKYIGVDISPLVNVRMDDRLRDAVALQKPVTLSSPTAPGCADFLRLADRLHAVFQSDRIPRVSFARYWEKLAARMARKRQVAGDKEASLYSAKPAETTSSVWDEFRAELDAFLANPMTTPEQVSSVMVSCLSRHGESLGASVVDLMHLLVQSVKPEVLAPEHRVLIRNDLSRLLQRFERLSVARQHEPEAPVRAAPSRVENVSLLESIRYASLVRSDGV